MNQEVLRCDWPFKVGARRTEPGIDIQDRTTKLNVRTPYLLPLIVGHPR